MDAYNPELDDFMTKQEAETLLEEIRRKLPPGWEATEPRCLWFSDEWRIDLLSDRAGWIVRNPHAWQHFREIYDLVPCRECGTPFYRETFVCPQCKAERF